MDLKEEAALGDVGQHWYYRAKASALSRAVGDVPRGHVLDVGAGSGFFSRHLIRTGAAASATCVDPGYPADRDEEEAGVPLRFRRAAGAAGAGLVLMMDVLEHVDDDAGLVRDYAATAAPGTQFLVTVPAFSWLWSEHDEFLEHRRRYTLRQAEAALRAGGLEVEFGCYFYGTVLPLAMATRFAGKLRARPPGPPRGQMRAFGAVANAVLWAACAAELPLFRLNRLCGLTVMVRARKP